MKSGVHKDTLPLSFSEADLVYIYQGEDVAWQVDDLKLKCPVTCHVEDTIARLVDKVCQQAQAGDIIVVMSNGGFEGIHDRLLAAL